MKRTMRPYQNIKLDACPDVADGKADGRTARRIREEETS